MERISVSVRVRPLNRQEAHEGFAWKVDTSSTICQVDPLTRKPDLVRDSKYTLDYVFGPERTTLQIYEATTQGLTSKVVNGFNSTVFAYGQTSSGKVRGLAALWVCRTWAHGLSIIHPFHSSYCSSCQTFTMRGSPAEPGIVSLAVNEVFQRIESTKDREFLLRVSYMEVSAGAVGGGAGWAC